MNHLNHSFTSSELLLQVANFRASGGVLVQEQPHPHRQYDNVLLK
jgi:hypothetical protein